MGQILISVMAP